MKRLVFICCICLAAIASQHTATARSHQQSDESAGLTATSIHAAEEASAQPVVRYSRPTKAAFKTNLLYDATASVNFGVEFAVAPKLTIDISGNFHPWILPGGRRLTHLLVQPELRWWIKERFKYRLDADESLYAENSTVQYSGPTKGALNIVYLF